MKALFMFTTLFVMVAAPVLVVVIGQEMFKFFTQDLDQFDQWQEEED